ncbi:MAG: hypothetical protein ACP6IU_14595 [Candidatus Asgardarchaeia archaeon]
MSEKKDLKLSFFVALYMTVIVFSMFLPVITATQTVEDSDEDGNLWWNGWYLKAYVKGYYDTNNMGEFFRVYHYAEVNTMWGFYVDKASWEFCGRERINNEWVERYSEDGGFTGSNSENYYKGTDWPNNQKVQDAYTYVWARFKRDTPYANFEKTVRAEVTAPKYVP